MDKKKITTEKLMRKKILLITYTFTPEQNPRAFRWQTLTAALSADNFDIDVLVPKQKNIEKRLQTENIRCYETERYPFYNFINRNRLDIKGNYISKKYKRNNYNLKISIKKVFSFVAKKLIWPDLYIFWFFIAKKRLKEMVEEKEYDCVISSAPTFVCHLLGYYAKSIKKNIQWIAEYGDPYSFNPGFSKKFLSFLDKKIEEIIIKKMDYLVVPVEKSKVGFLKHFSSLQESKIKVISHSSEHIPADPGDIDWNYFDDQLINIAYTGMMYPKIRNPKILLESLVRFKKKYPDNYKKLRFHFFGHYKNVETIFEEYRELLDDKSIIIYGEVLRKNCSFACQKSDFLLNISNMSDYQSPSKLIEYLSYKKPIISLDSKKNTELNWSFLIKIDYNIENVVKSLYNLSTNKFDVSFNDYDDIIKNYSIDKILRQYIDLIIKK
ncbi:MAG: hypothetical protein NT094_02785 [Candidatus Staskawiczbacteria bacterium]|nr:hypothetical protein [Candidatus Staskawiczbacteria bacterium]